MNSTRPYIMEDAREGQRLLDKADASTWIAKFVEPLLHRAKSVLSVGCGPAVFLREIAEAYPKIDAVGVDISSVRVGEAQQRLHDVPNARAIVGDALSLPFEDNTFDLVFCRFLLEYLPDKLRAVREMARVCSAGGKILLQDLDGQLLWHFPEDVELRETTERVLTYLATTGFDPFVGRKLFSLTLGAALTDINVQLDPYHLYAGTIDPKQFSHWKTKLEIARPQLKSVLGSDEAANRYTERFLAYLQSPETLTYSCLFTVTATKPTT